VLIIERLVTKGEMPWGCLNDRMGWFLCVEHDREEIHPVPDGPKDVVTKLISQAQLRFQILNHPFLPVSVRKYSLSKGFSTWK
jgi:hypothetical protein